MPDYAIICCTGNAIAYLNIGRKGRRVKVTPAEPAHMTIAVNPVVDGNPTWPPGQFHEMVTAAAVERQVTEVAWPTHRSWIIRCNSCTEQAQVSGRNLPALAVRLQSRGDWPVIDKVRIVPLGVLNRMTVHLNG